MKAQNLKVVGIACFVLCAICLFIAFERYQANRSAVDAMNKMQNAFGGLAPFGQITPAVPSATKYALFFALLSGAGGLYCLVKGGQPKSDSDSVA